MDTETSPKICCHCGCCNITYYFLFAVSLFCSLGLHIFDVGSDIYVLTDLYTKSYEFFIACLTIMGLSFIGSSIASGLFLSDEKVEKDTRFDLKSCHEKPFCTKLGHFFLGLFQLGMFIETYRSLKIGQKTHPFVWSRLVEGLFESCPQSLFQLFVVLQSGDNFSVFDTIRYYSSIGISIFSISMVMVTFEFYRYHYEVVIKKQKHIEGIEKLSVCSSYGFTLFIHRFSELLSNILFFGCLGYAYNGNAIIVALAINLVLSAIFFILKLKDIKIECRLISMFFFLLIKQIMFLPAYSKQFSSRMPGDTKDEHEMDNYHWLVKFLIHAGISYFIIVKLVSGDYHISFLIITIMTYISYIISLISLYFIRKWNKMVNSYGSTEGPKDANYIEKFKGYKCCC